MGLIFLKKMQPEEFYQSFGKLKESLEQLSGGFHKGNRLTRIISLQQKLQQRRTFGSLLAN